MKSVANEDRGIACLKILNNLENLEYKTAGPKNTFLTVKLLCNELQ